MLRFRCFIVTLLMAIVFLTQANAATVEKNFYRNLWNPTYHIQRLSYCSYDGKECGLKVASRYCKLMGYQKAVKEIQDYNVGVTNYLLSPKERIKVSRIQCTGWKCNGFKLIRCVGKFSHKPPRSYYYRSRRFVFPRFDHYRVDWCYENGKGCGHRAAHSFCRRQGYIRTQAYKIQKNVASTKALGNQKLCFGKQCSGFTEISCYR